MLCTEVGHSRAKSIINISTKVYFLFSFKGVCTPTLTAFVDLCLSLIFYEQFLFQTSLLPTKLHICLLGLLWNIMDIQ